MRGSHALALSAGILGLAIGFVAGWMLAPDVKPEEQLAGALAPPDAPAPGPNAIPSLPAVTSAPGAPREADTPRQESEGDESSPPGEPAGAAKHASDDEGKAPTSDAAVVRVTVLRHDGSPVKDVGVFGMRTPPEVTQETVVEWWKAFAEKNPKKTNSITLPGGNTDAKGRREIAVPDGGHILVGYWTPWPRMEAVQAIAGRRHEVEIRLPAPARPGISGTVWDADGSRLAGAPVRARWKRGAKQWVRASTDERGRFQLPRLGAHAGTGKAELILQVMQGEAHRFHVELLVVGKRCRVSSYAGGGSAVLIDDGPEPKLELAVPRKRETVTVRGRVQISADADLEQLEVDWNMDSSSVDAGGELVFHRSVRVNARQEFEFEVGAPSTILVRVLGPDCGSAEHRLELQAGADPDPITLVVVPQVRPRIEIHGGDTGRVECDVSLTELDDGEEEEEEEGFDIPGLTFAEEVDIEEDGVIRIPWGLKGRWKLVIDPGDELAWRRKSVEFEGGQHPTIIVLAPMVPVLDGAVRVSGGVAGDVFVHGEWRSGGESGEFDWDQFERDGVERLRVACEAPAAEVELTLTLRMVGYRPIRVGPVKLRGGRPIDLRELVFKRD